MHHAKKLAAAMAVAALSMPAFAENCTDTTFSTLASSSCRGAFTGNINGDTSEITYLNDQFGGSFTYIGKSDDAGHGPFTSNPVLPTTGTLTFDTPITGSFVIGLKAATNYSYYFFSTASPVSSITFNSLAGVAVNDQGIPQMLSHANLYVQAVPEPETYALMLAGLAALGFVSRRRKTD